MKIPLHIARLRNGLTDKLAADTDLDRLYADLAKECRKQWANHDWGMDEEGHNENPVPPIPDNPKDVVEMFYHDDFGTPEGPWIHWGDTLLDISPPYDKPIVLSVEKSFLATRLKPKFTGTRFKGGAAVLDGTLVEEMGEISDALEGFILALTAAGFPVHLEEFHKVLQDYIPVMVDHLADRTAEDNERRMAIFGWSIDLDRVTEQWAITKEGENGRRCDVTTDRYDTRPEAVAAAMLLMGRKESE